jgi:threonylcarbamoyladenosine tRNA methylthiotransferase MtaB
MGYVLAQEGEEAEICIVNTCTVTDAADSGSRHEIRKLAKQNPNSKLVVTGCFAEQNPEAVKNLEGVTHLVANKDKENLIPILFPEEEVPEFSIRHFEAHTRAFVKVQDGCNSYCTYCIIPYVRGRSRSRPMPDILREVEELIANGYKEVVLTGINIGDFVGENGERLADLVRAVDQIEGLKRLRVSSIDPDEVDDDLMDAIIHGKNTCPSMHIVLQAGSNVVLKRMNRKYTRQIFMETVEKLKAAQPDFTFTTDVIVGFPGETEADFEETLAVMREVKFAKVHMFPYSERPRTRAAMYPNKVPQEIIKLRKQEVLRLVEQMGFELRSQFIGRKMLLLTENNHSTETTGHTANFLEVKLEGHYLEPNQLVEVEMIGNTPEGLIARPSSVKMENFN